MASTMGMPWSHGEHKMHELTKVPEHDNPTSEFLTPQAAFASTSFPLIAVGVLDNEKRPWTTVWGGEVGISRPLGQNLLGTRTIVDSKNDPVIQALVEQKFGNGSSEGKGMMISALPIDLKTRRRVKMFGRVAAGAVSPFGEGDASDSVGEIQLVTKVEQSLGNCPKYLNAKEIKPAIPQSELITASAQLNAEAVALLNKSDLFFLSSANQDIDMDSNYRGGPAGFIRVISPGSTDDSTPASIIYPEYSGNRLYQSLGNLIDNPAIGICVPDFDTGDVLYITGTTKILVGNDASRILPRTNLAVHIEVIEARFVKQGLPFRGINGEPSPYNPHVRLLATEGNIAAQFEAKTDLEATLVAKDDITSTISRYRFRTDQPVSYKPGQWVALDFSSELDEGYSHMRDDDPTSLNDDFVRTFTVSSHPKAVSKNEFELVTRLHGPVTTFLKQHKMRIPMEVPVKAFGGDFVIAQEENSSTHFIAGGVGITPLLGQLDSLNLTKLQLYWILKLEDIDFVLNIFKRYPDLATQTKVYFTSADKDVKRLEAKIDQVQSTGTDINMRRLTKEDLESINTEKWYLCAGNPLRAQLLSWLDGKIVIYENFDY